MREWKSVGAPQNAAAPASRSLAQSIGVINEDCEQRGHELLKQFESELTKIGGRFHRAPTAESAVRYIEELASDRHAKTIIGWETEIIDGIDLSKRLEANGIKVVTETTDRDFVRTAALADIGISGADYALADTGTLVLLARRGQARSISLLPAVHVAVIRPEDVISGLSELFPLMRDARGGDAGNLSSAITFITGPSRTADIELTLVVGVHGPQELHVVLIGGDIAA